MSNDFLFTKFFRIGHWTKVQSTGGGGGVARMRSGKGKNQVLGTVTPASSASRTSSASDRARIFSVTRARCTLTVFSPRYRVVQTSGSGRTRRTRRARGPGCANAEWWRREDSNLRHGAYETPALPPELRRLGRNFAQLQSGILTRLGAGARPIVPGTRATRRGNARANCAEEGQDASEDAARGAGGKSRSTAWRRAPASTGFMRTGAAWRIRKFAYSGV
jgi:hypothetical protein